MSRRPISWRRCLPPVLCLAVLASACGSGSSAESSLPATFGPASELPHDGDGPTGVVFGVPVGWSHDVDGATAAASAFVGLTGLVATSGPLVRRDVVLAMATPSYGPTLVDATARDLDDLMFSLGERSLVLDDLRWGEHTLTATAMPRSDDEVQVQVWSVVVITAGDDAVPRQLWRTSTIDLVWVDDDWKVDQWATTPGPVPAPPAEVDVASGSEIREVLAWPPTPEAVGP